MIQALDSHPGSEVPPMVLETGKAAGNPGFRYTPYPGARAAKLVNRCRAAQIARCLGLDQPLTVSRFENRGSRVQGPPE